MNIMNFFSGVFNKKTILITGHTGFQGTWLSLWLNLLGANVVGYSLNPPTSPSLFELTNLENEITHHVSDVRDLPQLKKIIKQSDLDFVFHLAAQPIVRQSYKNPIETFETNVMGTINLLESIRNTNVKVCEIITSDKCYDNNQSQKPHTENDPMGGIDPYSASKGAAEIVTSAYRNSFFHKNFNNSTAIATIRAGNVIGGGDWATDRIVPDCIRQLVAKKPIKLRNPSAIRPWQFILEPIFGMLLLASKMFNNPESFSESWNFGPDTLTNDITVQKLVKLIINEWNQDIPINLDNAAINELHEEKILRIDCTKAKKRLGWKTRLDINETIEWTVNWYKEYFKNSDMKKYTENQIARFTSL